MTKLMMLSAAPAFLLATFAVRGLARLGISELLTFMLLTPSLILAWYYTVGFFIDRWLARRSEQPET